MPLPTSEVGHFPAEIYDSMQASGIEVIKAQGMIASQIDLREFTKDKRSLDLHFRIPLDCQKAISDRLLTPTEKFFREKLGTEQIFYKPDWLHSTLFQFITCDAKPNFDPDREDVEPYKEVSRIILADFAPLEVSYKRFLWSSGGFPGLVLGGEPSDNTINQARDRIKLLASERRLRLFRAQPSHIFHIVIMRNLTPIGTDRVGEVIDFINQRDQEEIWAGRLDTVNLVLGDYIMRPQMTSILETYQLQ